MDAAFPLLGTLCFLALLFAALAGIAVLVIFLARELTRKTDKNWQQVADNLGLTYRRDEVKKPFITGRLNGIDVQVKTAKTIETVTRPDSTHRKAKIWTHVIATPAVKPDIEVWLRKNDVSERPGLSALSTGDADFDERYKLFAADGADVDSVCPPAIRSVMLQTAREVQIADQSVIWSNFSIEQDQARLTEALQSCAQVARAIEDHARDNTETDR